MPWFEIILLQEQVAGSNADGRPGTFCPRSNPSRLSLYAEKFSSAFLGDLGESAAESEWLTSQGFETALLLHSSTHSYSGVRSRGSDKLSLLQLPI